MQLQCHRPLEVLIFGPYMNMGSELSDFDVCFHSLYWLLAVQGRMSFFNTSQPESNFLLSILEFVSIWPSYLPQLPLRAASHRGAGYIQSLFLLIDPHSQALLQGSPVSNNRVSNIMIPGPCLCVMYSDKIRSLLTADPPAGEINVLQLVLRLMRATCLASRGELPGLFSLLFE